MRKYPKYKDSGVEWIGEIPQGWDLNRLKYISYVRGSNVDKNIYPDEKQLRLCNYTDVYKNEKIDSLTTLNLGSCTEEEFEKFTIKKDDVIITKDSETPDDIGIPCLISENLNDTVCGYHLSLITPNSEQILGGYLFRQFQTERIQQHYEVHSYGITRYGLGKSIIENTDIILPSLPEQNQIVEFLDQKTSIIDELIGKKQRKVELLKEHRTSIINHTVTKGLNPHVKLKDSGVEWIGQIPEGWVIKPLKYFSQITLGKMLTSEDKGGYSLKPYLRSLNIQSENVNVSDVNEMWFSPDELVNLRLLKGDLLVNEGGDVGRTCMWNNEIEECYIQNSVNRVRVLDGYNQYYLFHFLRHHFTGYLNSVVNRVSIPHLTKDKLSNITFCIPPLPEQNLIVQYLDKKTKEIDTTVTLENKKIELLKEYRQSLISEVVTGKIDVRKN